MSDDPEQPKIVTFVPGVRRRAAVPEPAPAPPPTEPPPEAEVEKFGVYPLGGDDVVMSYAVFEGIIQLLLHGSEADRKEYGAKLRESYNAFFRPVTR